jgi:hypothetical protein
MPRPARLLKLRIIVGVLWLTGCAKKDDASFDTQSVGAPSTATDTGFIGRDSVAMEIPPIHDPRDTIRTTKDSLKGDSIRKE